MIAHLLKQGTAAKTPYNPRSPKRRGDAFDLMLLFYVPLPAVVVTADTKFVNGLRQSGAKRAGQVLTVAELHDELRSGTLTDRIA